eukprot:snap_masked-scaffold_24-processed-gene-5.27-mRNA-1 protein AED:1.00 eAED:1.00 QI:0/0/0/0/1/1/2/0/482
MKKRIICSLVLGIHCEIDIDSTYGEVCLDEYSLPTLIDSVSNFNFRGNLEDLPEKYNFPVEFFIYADSFEFEEIPDFIKVEFKPLIIPKNLTLAYLKMKNLEEIKNLFFEVEEEIILEKKCFKEDFNESWKKNYVRKEHRNETNNVRQSEEILEEEIFYVSEKTKIFIYSFFFIVLFLICLFCLYYYHKNEQNIFEKIRQIIKKEKTISKTKNTIKYFSLFSLWFCLFDLTTDIVFYFELRKQYSDALSSSLKEGSNISPDEIKPFGFLILLSIFSFCLPILCNLFLSINFMRKKIKNGSEKSRKWIEENEVLNSMFSVEVLQVSNCGIGKLTFPLTQKDIYILRSYSIINNILEDIPQIILILLVRYLKPPNPFLTLWSPTYIFSFTTSILSLFWTLCFRFQSKSFLSKINRKSSLMKKTKVGTLILDKKGELILDQREKQNMFIRSGNLREYRSEFGISIGKNKQRRNSVPVEITDLEHF